MARLRSRLAGLRAEREYALQQGPRQECSWCVGIIYSMLGTRQKCPTGASSPDAISVRILVRIISSSMGGHLIRHCPTTPECPANLCDADRHGHQERTAGAPRHGLVWPHRSHTKECRSLSAPGSLKTARSPRSICPFVYVGLKLSRT